MYSRDRCFAVPYNGDNELLKLSKEQGLDKCIREFYGTDGRFASGRLRKTNGYKLNSYIAELRNNDIEFNYLFNALNCDDYIIRESELYKSLRDLESYGVTTLTISHPILTNQILEMGFVFKVNTSVNQFVNTVNKAQELERQGYSRITLDEDMLRDILLVEKIAKQTNSEIELLINNACHNGCIHRTSHQALLSSVHPEMNHTRRSESIQRIKQACSSLFREDLLLFLRSNWIRPEDLWRYKKIGVSVFKLSGRTFSSEGIIKSLAAYAYGHYEGNVLDYIKPDLISPKRYGFNKLLDSQVSPYFDHIWLDCDRGVCPECRSIALQLMANMKITE